MPLHLRDRPADLELVHLDDRRDEMEVVARVAGEQLQERDVLREARAAEADSGAQVLRADPPVEAHPARDVLDVGADQLADVGDLVDERDPRGEVRVGGELDHLGRRDVHLDDRRVEGLVQRGDGLGGCRVEGTDDDAIGLEEVAHGRALGEELRARRVADLGQPAAVELCPYLLARADRHGALHHEHDRPEILRQVLDHRPDRGEVRVARRGRRSADADEEELTSLDRLLHREREGQAVGVAFDQLREARLEERQAPGAQPVDPLGNDVTDDDRVAEIGEAGTADEAGVPGAEERDPCHSGAKATSSPRGVAAPWRSRSSSRSRCCRAAS